MTTFTWPPSREGIAIVEELLEKKALIDRRPRRAGDQSRTHANIAKARRILGYEPAEILGERLHVRPKTIKKLHNLDQGLWQGLLFDDVKSKQPKVYRQWQERPETVCPPEGETVQEACERLKGALAKITKKHKSGTIALVLARPLASVMGSLLQSGQTPCLCSSTAGKPMWEPIEVAAE